MLVGPILLLVIEPALQTFFLDRNPPESPVAEGL
jgi:hypothetical protein